jgi:hypothetical protein
MIDVDIDITLSEEEIEEINNSDMASDHYTILPKKRNKILGIYPCMLLQYLQFKYNWFKKEKLLTEDGFFYQTRAEIEEETNLTREKQDTALEKLTTLGLVTTKIAGQPAKKYYKINSLAMFLLFHQKAKTFTSCLCKSHKLACVDHTANNKQYNNLRFNTSCSSTFSESACKKIKPIIKKNSRKEYIKKGIKETLAKNQEKREQIKKAKLVRTTTFEIDTILDYWRSKGLTVHREGTKAYACLIDRIKSLLKGTLFNSFTDKSNHNRKFSMEEIKRAIDNYCLAAYNSDYEPSKKTFLQELKFMDFFLTDRPCPEEKRKSVFLQFLLEKPKQISESKIYGAKDDYPHASKIIADWYKKTFGNRDGGKYSLRNRNDIVYATKEIAKFYEKNKNVLNIENWKTMYSQTDPIAFLSVQLTRAMDKVLRENDIMFSSFNTSWLKSEKTFNERLPSFLRKEQMMRHNQ